MKRVIITSVLVALITASTLTGCAPAKPAPDAVAVQLSWFHTVEFAGFYTAVEKGFYAAENLAVSLLPGGPDADPLKSVKDGTAQFGVTSGNDLVRARGQHRHHGHHGHLPTQPASRDEPARQPFVTVGATSPRIPSQVGDLVFLACFGDNVQAAAGAEFGFKTYGPTVYLLWNNDIEYTTCWRATSTPGSRNSVVRLFWPRHESA